MNFIEENPEFSGWYPIVTVLLGTGMRIGECLGLRWDDLDFDKRLISVTHTLSDRPVGKEHTCERHIMEPKHILIVLKAVAALYGCGYGFFDFSLEKKIRKQ